jgi:hypothetical protein
VLVLIGDFVRALACRRGLFRRVRTVVNKKERSLEFSIPSCDSERCPTALCCSCKVCSNREKKLEGFGATVPCSEIDRGISRVLRSVHARARLVEELGDLRVPFLSRYAERRSVCVHWGMRTGPSCEQKTNHLRVTPMGGNPQGSPSLCPTGRSRRTLSARKQCLEVIEAPLSGSGVDRGGVFGFRGHCCPCCSLRAKIY